MPVCVFVGIYIELYLCSNMKHRTMYVQRLDIKSGLWCCGRFPRLPGWPLYGGVEYGMEERRGRGWRWCMWWWWWWAIFPIFPSHSPLLFANAYTYVGTHHALQSKFIGEILVANRSQIHGRSKICHEFWNWFIVSSLSPYNSNRSNWVELLLLRTTRVCVCVGVCLYLWIWVLLFGGLLSCFSSERRVRIIVRFNDLIGCWERVRVMRMKRLAI